MKIFFAEAFLRQLSCGERRGGHEHGEQSRVSHARTLPWMQFRGKDVRDGPANLCYIPPGFAVSLASR